MPGRGALVFLIAGIFLVRLVGIAEGGGLQSPVRIALGPGDTLLVSDYRRHKILLLGSRDLGILRTFDVSGRPLAVAWAGGHVYVGNETTHRVEVYDGWGQHLYDLGGPEGTVQRPTDMAVDGLRGLLFVVDAGRKVVKVFQLQGWMAGSPDGGADAKIVDALHAPRLIQIAGGLGPDPTAYISPKSRHVGYDSVEILVSADVRLAGPDSWCTTSTGGSPPAVTQLVQLGDGLHRLTFSGPIEVGEWTTVTLGVETACGAEARLSFQVAQLPNDLNQDGQVNLNDATKFGQLFPDGPTEIEDVDGNGQNSLADATKFGQIWNGTSGEEDPRDGLGWRGKGLPDRPAGRCAGTVQQVGLYTIPQGGSDPDQLTQPTGIAIDPDRREVLVSDHGDPALGIDPRVQVFDYAGVPLREISGKVSGGMLGSKYQFSRPQGLAVDGDGHVFVAASWIGKVLVFDHVTGEQRSSLGGFGTDPGQLALPLDVVIRRCGGDVFVTNNRAGRVEVFAAGARVP